MNDISFTRTVETCATPSQVWQGLIDPAKVAAYHLAPLKEIELREGGRIVYGTEDADLIVGQITRLEPNRRLEHTFRFQLHEVGIEEEPETLVSYLIEENPNGSTLTLTHSGFPGENQTFANISGGWPHILDGLKAFLEGKRV